jgi:hypothetical protein
MATAIRDREQASLPGRPAVRQRTGLGRNTYTAVGVVLVLQGTVIGWFAAHSWFFVDDFLFLRQARDSNLTFAYVRLPLFEHFSPVHRLLDWLLVVGARPSWPVAVVILVGIALACSTAFAYAVSGITRNRRVIVCTTAVYALSLFFVRTAIWWTAGIHLMLLTFFSLLTLGGYARWHYRRTVRSLILSYVALTLALLTHEDALLLLGILVMMRLLILLPHPRSLGDSFAALRGQWRVWIVYVALTAVAAWNFVTWYWEQATGPTFSQLVEYMWNAIAEGFFSTLLLIKVPEAMIHSPGFTGVLAMSVGVVVIAATTVTRVGAWRGWLFFAVAFIATALPLGLSRVHMFGPTIGRDPIYQLGPAFIFLLAVAAVAAAPARRSSSLTRRWSIVSRSGVAPWLVGLVALGFVGLYLHSSFAAEGTAQAAGTRGYFANLRSDISALQREGTRPVLFDGVVPDPIVPQWLFPYNRYDSAIALMEPTITFDSAAAAYLVDGRGHLRRVRVDEQFSTTAHTGSCLEPSPGAASLSITLPRAVTGDSLVIRLDYKPSASTTQAAIVSADGHPKPATLGPTGTVYSFVERRRVTAVSVTPSDPAACVERVSVGRLLRV